MQLMLIGDVLQYRTDTVLVVVDDPKYLMPSGGGAYRYPEEAAIYGCKLDALELLLKRALMEMEFPFILTRAVHRDSLKKIDLGGYQKYGSFFPLYITKKIRPCYDIPAVAGKAGREISGYHLPDTIAAFLDSLYRENCSRDLYHKYAGEGACGAYRNYSLTEFRNLGDDKKKEQRRAFLRLPEAGQNKARTVDIGVSSLFECMPWDEIPGNHFPSFAERKVHELEVNKLLAPYFSQAVFALLYPMSRVHNLNFILQGQNENSIMLIALKSGRAPAQYQLERKDCPKILKMGMFADITDILSGWDQMKNLPQIPMQEATYLKCLYGMPYGILTTDAVEYRRDWLEERGVIEWVRKKGWIHPKDGRPYIPMNWTYDDFRVLCKLIADNDVKKIRKGFVERPGPMMYLDAYSVFHFSATHFLKPNPSRETTWLFNKEDPLFLRGMKTIHDMCWIDKSIRTGVEVSYSSAQDDFKGGRTGMAYTISHGVLNESLLNKYTIFGKDRPYGDIVGLTSMPGCDIFPNLSPGDCNLLGFNPGLSPEQLRLAVEWVKECYYGEFFNTGVSYDVEASRILGTESVVLTQALASPCPMNYYGKVDFRSSFPANYIDFYDLLKAGLKYPPAPSMDEYGLTQPLTRSIADQVNTMFEKVIMDSMPDYNKILNLTANYINTTVLNFNDDNAVGKLKQYYGETGKYYLKYFPEYYPLWKADFDRVKYW
jgi:hypothetical protein